jgi:PAS domain S-box-containing protein
VADADEPSRAAPRVGALARDPHGVITDADDIACAITGRTRDELIGTAPPYAWCASDPLLAPSDATREITLTGADGAEAVVWAHVTPSCVGLVDDRADRARDALLREQANAYRLLADRTSDYVSVERGDQSIVYASPSVERVLGFRPEELVGTTSSALVHPDDIARSREDALATIAADGTFTTEMRLRRKDGTYIWAEIAGREAVADDGTPVRQVAVRDISRRRLAENTLRATEAIFRAVVQQTTDLIFVMDREEVRYSSPSLNQMLGKDALGLRFLDLAAHVHPDDLPAAMALFGEIWDNHGTHGSIELRMRDASDAWHLIELAATNLMTEPTVGGIVLSGRDITSHRTDQERRQKQLEVVGLLAAGAAHDFGNLLGVVANCTQLAMRQLAPDDPARSELETIEAAVERASELTHQLLQFGGNPSGRTVRVDLGVVASEVATMMARAADHHVRFVVDTPDSAVIVHVDRRRIERAVLNIMANARTATEAGGTVRVGVGTTEVDAARAALRGIAAGAYATVTVHDDGPGMTPEVQARAFEPFFTTAEGHRGTGLGLATAKDAIERAGGCIELGSTVGLGTTVVVLLPLAAEDAASATGR